MFGTKILMDQKPVEEVANLRIPTDNLAKVIGSTDIPILSEEACRKALSEVEQETVSKQKLGIFEVTTKDGVEKDAASNIATIRLQNPKVGQGRQLRKGDED